MEVPANLHLQSAIIMIIFIIRCVSTINILTTNVFNYLLVISLTIINAVTKTISYLICYYKRAVANYYT